MHLATHRHGVIVGQDIGHFRQLETQQPAHRHGGQRCGQMMSSPHRHAERTGGAPAAESLPTIEKLNRPRRLLVSNARTSHWLPGANPGDAHRAISGDAAEPGVIAKHGVAVRQQGRQQFGLGPGDIAAIAEPGQMGVADLRDDADFRPAQLAKAAISPG